MELEVQNISSSLLCASCKDAKVTELALRFKMHFLLKSEFSFNENSNYYFETYMKLGLLL